MMAVMMLQEPWLKPVELIYELIVALPLPDTRWSRNVVLPLASFTRKRRLASTDVPTALAKHHLRFNPHLELNHSIIE